MPDLISVIIPTYNRAALLEVAIDSVAEQGHRPIEVIVVDDGSTDDTVGLMERLAERHAANLRVRHVRQDRRGAAAARNRGLELAQGDAIQFLDSDDVLLPDALSRRAAALDQNPTVEVVYGDWLQGQSVASAVRFSRERITDPVVALLEGQWLPNFAYLARRGAIERVGRWDEAIAVADDFDFLLRLAIGCRFAHVPGLTGFYRWHPRPRLSRQDLDTYLAAQMLILDRAEGLITAGRNLSEVRRQALLARYRSLAADALGENDEALHELGLRIQRLRRQGGAGPGRLEAALGFERWLWMEKHIMRLPRTIRRSLVGRLSPDTRRALRLAINRLTEATGWKA